MKKIMAKTLLSLAVVLLAVDRTFALNAIELDQPPKVPAFLVPVDPGDRKYEAAIESLLSGRLRIASMIYTTSPYAGKDLALCVSGKDFNGDTDHPRQRFITLIEVTPARSKTRATLKNKLDVRIDDDLAIAIQRAWATMLLKTRFPTNRYRGVDGSAAEFSVFVAGAGTIYGQLWSPSGGLPKELLDLGLALADYCRSSELERPTQRQKLLGWLADFEKRAAKA